MASIAIGLTREVAGLSDDEAARMWRLWQSQVGAFIHHSYTVYMQADAFVASTGNRLYHPGSFVRSKPNRAPTGRRVLGTGCLSWAPRFPQRFLL